METAASVISDALEDILVQAAEQPLLAADFQKGRRTLNRMMDEFAAQGLNLGYTKVTQPTDLVTVPDGAISGIIANLAKKLLPAYDMPVTTELMLNAKDGLTAIRNLAVTIEPSSLPCTLPIGSGNEYDNAYNTSHFYNCPEDDILTEQEGSILLESNTNE